MQHTTCACHATSQYAICNMQRASYNIHHMQHTNMPHTHMHTRTHAHTHTRTHAHTHTCTHAHMPRTRTHVTRTIPSVMVTGKKSLPLCTCVHATCDAHVNTHVMRRQHTSMDERHVHHISMHTSHIVQCSMCRSTSAFTHMHIRVPMCMFMCMCMCLCLCLLVSLTANRYPMNSGNTIDALHNNMTCNNMEQAHTSHHITHTRARARSNTQTQRAGASR